jgi:hypothetical protein
MTLLETNQLIDSLEKQRDVNVEAQRLLLLTFERVFKASSVDKLVEWLPRLMVRLTRRMCLERVCRSQHLFLENVR